MLVFCISSAGALLLPQIRAQMPGTLVFMASTADPPRLFEALRANPAVASEVAAIAAIDGLYVTQAVPSELIRVGASTSQPVDWVKQEGYFGGQLVALVLDVINSDSDAGSWTAEDVVAATLDTSLFRVTSDGERVVLGPFSPNCTQGIRAAYVTQLLRPTSRPVDASAAAGLAPFDTYLSKRMAFDGCGVLDTTQDEAQDPYVFGQVAPFTNQPQWGEGLQLGIRAAFDDANRNGGIGGRFVQLESLDDGYDPARSLVQAQELIDKHNILGMIGSYGTATAQSMLTVLEPMSLPLIAPVTGARVLRHPFRRGVINVRASYDDEAFLLVKTAVDAGRTRCTILFQDDSFGRAGLEGSRLALWNSGLAIHSNASYDRASGDVGPAVETLRLRTPPEAVVVFAVTGPARDFICQSSALPGWEDVWYLSASIVSDSFATLLGDCNDRATVFVSSVFPDILNASVGVVASFQASLDRRCGGPGGCEYTPEALEGYMGARLLLQAMQRAGESIQAYSSNPDPSYEPARSIARRALLSSIYEAGMYSLEQLRLGPYGDACGNTVAVGARNLGCECNQGMHNVFLRKVISGAPRLNTLGLIETPRYLVRQPAGDVFFESCGVTLEFTPQAAQAIVFGQSASFSGDTAGLGRGMQAGIRAAFDKANRQGGVNGRQVRLVSFDDAYVPSLAVSNVREALNEHRVFGLIGTTGTPTASAIFPSVVAAEVPWVGSLTGAGFLGSPFVPSIINARASYADECAAMTKHLIARGAKRVIFFGQGDLFGDAGFVGIVSALRYHKLALLSDSRYPRGTLAVHGGIVSALSLEEPPQAIVMFGTAGPLGRYAAIIRVTFHNLGWPQPLLYATSFVGARAWRRNVVSSMATESTGTSVPNYLAGLFVASVVPVPDDASSALVAAFKADMVAAGLADTVESVRGQPSQFQYEQLEGYISGRLTTLALQRSSSSTRRDFIRAFYTTSMFQVAPNTQPLGPFVDGACNQASRQIWMIESDSDENKATGVVGDFAVTDTYDFSSLGCGVAAEYSRSNCNDGSERVSLSNETAAFTCRQCIRGTFSTGGAACAQCPAGSVAAEDGASSCTPCGPGRYQDRPGQGLCLGCDIFSFSAGIANARCEACGPFALTFVEGATSRSACKCNTGYFGDPRALRDPALLDAADSGAESLPALMPGPVAVVQDAVFPLPVADGLCRPCPVGASCCLRSQSAEDARLLAESQLVALQTNSSQINVAGADTPSTADRCVAGTRLPLPLPGHIESRVAPATLIECSPAQSCAGVDVQSVLNTSDRCAPGYEGVNCGDCATGNDGSVAYYSFYGRCLPCGESFDAWGRAAAMFVFVLVIVLSALEFSSRKSTYTGLGLLLNSLQIGGFFNQIFASWPRMAGAFYSAAAIVTFKLDSFSPECKLQSLYPRDVYERQLLWLALPFVFLAIFMAIYGIVLGFRAWNRFSGCRVSGRCQGFCGLARLLVMEPPKLNATFLSGFSRLAISGYPVLVSHSLTPMTCVMLSDGASVLQSYYSVECYDERWFRWVWSSVLGLVVYGIGIPLSLLVLIRAARHAAAARLAKAKHSIRMKRIEDAASRFGITAVVASSSAYPEHGDKLESNDSLIGELADAKVGVSAGSELSVGRSMWRALARGFRRGSSASSLVGGPSACESVDDAKDRLQTDGGANDGPGSSAAARCRLDSGEDGPDGDAGVDNAAALQPAKATSASARNQEPSQRPLRTSSTESGIEFDTDPVSATSKDRDMDTAADAHLGSSARPGMGTQPLTEGAAGTREDAGLTLSGTLSGKARVARWRPHRRSMTEMLGDVLGRVPSAAVLRRAHMSPTAGVNDELEGIIHQRASIGHDLVTKAELEAWHRQDMIAAHQSTSDILVDADHVLWPFIVDYREDAYYWALVEMAEFAAIVLASTFITDPVSQLSAMLLSVMAFGAAVLVMHPYRSEYFNRVEIFNDCAQILSLIIGISYVRQPRPLSEEASDVCLLLLISLNLLVLASSVVKDVADKVETWVSRSFWGTWTANAPRGRATRATSQFESRRRAQAQQMRRRKAEAGTADAVSGRIKGPVREGVPAGAAPKTSESTPVWVRQTSDEAAAGSRSPDDVTDYQRCMGTQEVTAEGIISLESTDGRQPESRGAATITTLSPSAAVSPSGASLLMNDGGVLKPVVERSNPTEAVGAHGVPGTGQSTSTGLLAGGSEHSDGLDTLLRA